MEKRLKLRKTKQSLRIRCGKDGRCKHERVFIVIQKKEEIKWTYINNTRFEESRRKENYEVKGL